MLKNGKYTVIVIYFCPPTVYVKTHLMQVSDVHVPVKRK